MDIVPRTPYVYRSMADGCAEILFHYRGAFIEQNVPDGRQPYGLLQAPSSHFRRFVTYESFGIFGAFLYPFAIPFLFNTPAHELSDHMPDLGLLAGNEGKILTERMMLAHNNEERVVILTQFFQSILKDKQPPAALASSVKKILHDETVNVGELAAHANVSVRQLERQFKDHVGFGPKLFSRIVRFQSALKAFHSGRSLTDIAHSCGYYDQSHFIHEFKQFSGYHPRQYFFGKPEGVEWREA